MQAMSIIPLASGQIEKACCLPAFFIFLSRILEMYPGRNWLFRP